MRAPTERHSFTHRGIIIVGHVGRVEEQVVVANALGSGLPALLYSGKRVCRPPGGRGGAGEGYMGASDGALSPGGSIWLTSRPVLEVLVRGAGLYEI